MKGFRLRSRGEKFRQEQFGRRRVGDACDQLKVAPGSNRALVSAAAAAEHDLRRIRIMKEGDPTAAIYAFALI